MDIQCSQCFRTFSTRHALVNHERSHANPGFKCPACQYSAKRKSNFNRHLNTVHKETLSRNLPLTKRSSVFDNYEAKRGKLDVKQEPVDLETVVKKELHETKTTVKLKEEPGGEDLDTHPMDSPKILENFAPSSGKLVPYSYSDDSDSDIEVTDEKPKPDVVDLVSDGEEESSKEIKDKPEMIMLESDGDDPKIKKELVNEDSKPNRVTLEDFNKNVPHPEVKEYYRVDIHRDYEHGFKTRFIDLRITFVNTENRTLAEQIVILRQIVENIVHVLVSNLPRYDKIRFVMMSDTFYTPISHKFVLLENWTADILFDAIQRVLNSAEEFRLDSSVSLSFIHQPMPKPAGGQNKLGAPHKRTIVSKKEYDRRKRSIITVANKDDLCVGRSLMIGKQIADKCYHESYKRSAQLTRDAKWLHATCGVPEGKCGLEEIKKFADHKIFEDYMVNVFSAQHLNARIFFTESKDKKINLLLDDGHCYPIRSVAGYLNYSHYCMECGKSYSRNTHKCKNGCPMCHRKECSNRKKVDRKEFSNYCMKCMTKFFTQECLDNHKQRDECKNKHFCKKCKTLVSKKSVQPDGSHPNCGLKYCHVCKKYIDPDDHLFCYIQPYKPKTNGPDATFEDEKTTDAIDFYGGDGDPDEIEAELAAKEKNEEKADDEKPVLYYYDTETEFETGVHKVILVHCQKETDESFEFYGEDSVEQFMKWLLNEKVKCWRILFAHNAKSFDAYPVMKYFYNNTMEPKVICDGQKILQIMYKPNKLIFRDSCCFLPFKLEAFSKAFSLDDVKTNFPYTFNTKDNREYIGPLPDITYYDPDSKTPEGRDEVIQWWNEEKTRLEENGLQFHLKDTMKEYCKNDVTLLRLGCQKYRTAMIESMGIDPLVSAITGASAIHLAYRKNYLEENAIAVVSDHGLQPDTHFSSIALCWLAWLMKENNCIIQCALNNKERHQGNYRLDGYMGIGVEEKPLKKTHPDVTGMVAFEFNGCLFHGHSCMEKSKKNPFTNQSMGQCRIKTYERKKDLENLGFTVIEQWECQFKEEMEANPELKEFVENFGSVHEPLKPRRGFFGGRTNAIKLYHEANEGEKILYYDFTSLYPYVNMYREYPVGPPTIIRRNFEDIRNYFGICQVTVLPPQGLFMPVLPSRTESGKLVFVLCSKCAEEEVDTAYCKHSEQERALKHQVYCTPELIKGLDVGYKVLSIDEVWHWPKKSDTLFRSFLLKWTKVKICSSGFPDHCKTLDEKQAFVDEQNKAYDLDIEVEDVTKNATMRSLAKLNLNCFWGRYGLNLNKRQTVITKNYNDYMKLHANANIEIHNVVDINDHLMLVNYRYEDENTPIQGNLSLVVALFTTCWARLHLYEQGLEKLQPDQILYMDTDSLIWVRRPGCPKLITGKLYGEFKDEIEDQYGAGATITKLFASGPKSYGYLVENGSEQPIKTIKVKGIPFTSRTLDQFDANAMLEAVLAMDGRVHKIDIPWKIHRNLKTATLFNRPETKRWRLVYTKRVIMYDYSYTTKPYGYYLV